MLYDVCSSIVHENHGSANYKEFELELIRWMSVESPISEDEYYKLDKDEITDKIFAVVMEAYKRKSQTIANQSMPVISEVYEKSSHIYENIIVPFTDGKRIYQILTNLKKSYESRGKELVKSFEKTCILATVDDEWKEHLREMDDLKHSVQNASYEQKDPLLIYKFESFELFKKMLDKINKDAVSILMKGHIPIRNASEVKEGRQPQKQDMSKFKTGREDTPVEKQNQQERIQPVRVEKKVGRNEPCPCGSGKKYKNCHGINAE